MYFLESVCIPVLSPETKIIKEGNECSSFLGLKETLWRHCSHNQGWRFPSLARKSHDSDVIDDV